MIRKLKKVVPRRTKIGHLGTLDPMATGVLPIALGHATRIIPWMEQDGKTYLAQMTLGGVSDTEDAWGHITLTGCSHFDPERLQVAFQVFTGDIQQVPPMYSAVHHQGQRLYQLARQGQIVERPARQVHIDQIRLAEIDDNGQLPVITMEVHCSAGTYIRTLCHDIGKFLGTGAYMSGLIRSRSGVFTLETACGLEEIQGDQAIRGLLPVDYPLRHWTSYKVSCQQEAEDIRHGRAVEPIQPMPEGWILVYDGQDKLLAIARSTPGQTGTVIRPTRVFNNNTKGSQVDEDC